MVIRSQLLVHIAAVLGSGMVAGVFLAFSNFIMQALQKLPAPQGIQAMQQINVTVITPLFMGLLFGTALLSISLAVLSFRAGLDSRGLLTVLAAVLYLAGVIGITMVFNVPLNDALAALALDDPAATSHWANYCQAWLGWNHLRGLCAALSCAAYALALGLQ